jgi:hypothetical protein
MKKISISSIISLQCSAQLSSADPPVVRALLLLAIGSTRLPRGYSSEARLLKRDALLLHQVDSGDHHHNLGAGLLG